MEGDIAHAHGFGLVEIVAAGIAAVAGGLAWRLAVEAMWRSSMGRKRSVSAGLPVSIDDVEDQAAAAGGQIELVTVVHVAAALDDDVGMRLEQADQLLAGRHRLAGEDPALGLADERSISGR